MTQSNRKEGAAMTMNPHTTASELRQTTRRAQAAASSREAAAKPAKRLITPAALFGAGFILAVSLIAKAFYD